MKVRLKLPIAFLVIIMLIWIIVLLANNNYTNISNEFEELEGTIVPSALIMIRMDTLANSIVHETRDYIYTGESETKQKILSNKELLRADGLAYMEHANIIGEEELQTATELLVKIQAITFAVDSIIDLKEQGTSYEKLLVDEQAIHPLLHALLEQLTESKDVLMEKLSESTEAVHAAHVSGRRILFLGAGLTTVLAFILTWLVVRSIVNPLHALHRGTEIIGKGDLSYKVGTEAKDEIGQLSRAFDQMTKDLSRTTTSISNLNKEITERQRVEEELRESEEKLRLMFEAAGEGIVVIDMENNILDVNQTLVRMHGFDSKEELIGRNALELSSEEDRARARDNTRRRLGRSLRGAIEYKLLKKDGSTFPALVNMAAIRDTKGNPIGYIGVFSDITERKRAEEEREVLLEDLQKVNLKLEESNRDLQDFVYVASHDLREPMRKIASFGTLLQVSLDGKLDEDQQENFQFMIDGSSRMQTMVDDLLTYSRVSTKTRPFEQVDLQSVVEDLKNIELATLLEETNGTIHIMETLPPLYGDSPQIHQLLQNIIGNGLKFRREGVTPEITIGAQRIKGNMVRVEVQDNGIGIDEKYYEQIFTMFKRLHSRTHYEGTGIGLAVCKKIVRRHGGEIGVKSTPGKGSTFWFTLPRG